MDCSGPKLLFKAIFVFVFFNYICFNIIYLFMVNKYPYFTRRECSDSNCTEITGYFDRVEYCDITGFNSTLVCVEKDYPARRFVMFGFLERLIPLVMYISLAIIPLCDTLQRRFRIRLRWVLLAILILFLGGDLMHFTAYLVYIFYVGSALNFNYRHWCPYFTLGLSNIVVCITSEWTYMIYATLKMLKKRRNGIAVEMYQVYCFTLSRCCLRDPDELKATSPNYTTFKYKHFTVQEGSERAVLQDRRVVEALKMFTYLYGKPEVENDSEGDKIAEYKICIDSIEYIGEERTFNKYQKRRDTQFEETKLRRHTKYVPYERHRKWIKPIDTANWIEKLLPEESPMKQAVDRDINEFYMFSFTSGHDQFRRGEDSFLVDNLTRFLGRGFYFQENSKENTAFNQGTYANRVYTMVLARVLLGDYKEVEGGKAMINEALSSSSCDTVVAVSQSPRRFVVKNKDQIYPEFLIRYTSNYTRV